MKSLFTPAKSFEMMDDTMYAEYRKDDASPSIKTSMNLKTGKACWAWLSNHADVKDRLWCEVMLTDEMIEEIDRCFVENFGDEKDLNFLDENETWIEGMSQYVDDISNIFDTHILERSWADASEKEVRIQLDRKREFIFLDQSTHYSIVLPLMTQSVIYGLAQAFERVPNAIREVRFTYLFYSMSVCNRYTCTDRNVSIRAGIQAARIETFLSVQVYRLHG